jgi:SAM-dependent methyltransferase
MNATQQTAIWNGLGGHAWVESQESLDRMFQPFEHLLVAAVSALPSVSRVLDVGCGTGSTTLAISRALGPDGRVTGIDISDPMLTRARARAEQEAASATFIRADAQSYAFEPATFDRIVSRFGVMFFDDPVRAFQNLRHAAKANAELCFLAWRSAAENAFMTTAERAAAPLLPSLPVRRPDAPGQFAFADPLKVRRILEESGWTGAEIRAIDVPCTLAEKDLERYFTTLGPTGLILHEADVATRQKVVEALRAAFEPYVHGSEARFTAACWMVNALAS